MAFVGSRSDELRESLLFESGGVLIVEPLGRRERRGERLGNNQVTHTKRRKHRSRKCSHVDDSPFGIQALQRLERLAFVAKFSVVVVLNDHGILPPRPFEKRQPPREWKNRASRKLV